ncbi:MAG: AgmX/PglI C-terminal domain-containing protein [Sandaracinaceae bacterium]|jgi:TonB family protein|nr:AgmX/PglI C-terminal domain-containing protein [Sandaracinaceae bacterium]
MSDSVAPLPPSHNGLKFAVIGGVLVTAALLLLFCSPGEEPPAALPMLDAGVTPTTSQFQNEFELPVEEPDAGPAVVAVAEDTSMRPATMRAVRDCEGTIAPAALQAAVTRYRGQVRQCYERALKQNNMLQGRVTVTVGIGANGRVETASASGPLGSSVNSCVTAAARTWQLVAPTGGTCATARVPFNMTPTN